VCSTISSHICMNVLRSFNEIQLMRSVSSFHECVYHIINNSARWLLPLFFCALCWRAREEKKRRQREYLVCTRESSSRKRERERERVRDLTTKQTVSLLFLLSLLACCVASLLVLWLELDGRHYTVRIALKIFPSPLIYLQIAFFYFYKFRETLSLSLRRRAYGLCSKDLVLQRCCFVSQH
jgi:hypothetical protein